MNKCDKSNIEPGYETWTIERLIEKGMQIPNVRFADEIARFTAQDLLASPPGKGVVFVGDSDIRLWNFDGVFDQYFTPCGAINRGFGGARTWEVLLYFEQLILRYQPRLIVYCCGGNDFFFLDERQGESAITGFNLFLDTVVSTLPATTRVIYLAMHNSPHDVTIWDEMREANEQLQSICENSYGRAVFFEYNNLLMDSNGAPLKEMFRPDGLHFSNKFYHILSQNLRPLISD